ncbi:MAG: glutathione S-transferase family protein [Deltaproteobacteria bacterium]|nr:glutathione S-transferase family protein [Deltaproteobacteria bacterium]
MMKIVIASKNYSSWSLRGWLALEQTGAPYEEILISTADADWHEQTKRVSPSGKVPLLIDGELQVHDSLAIVEYLNERFPAAGLWPGDPTARALARSVVAEMHSGFLSLRMNMPMDIQANEPGKGHTEDVLADVARIQEIWRVCRERHGRSGPFLFGTFTAADCFYAPVVFRFRSYGVALDANAKAYCDAMIEEGKVSKWVQSARREKRIYQE